MAKDTQPMLLLTTTMATTETMKVMMIVMIKMMMMMIWMMVMVMKMMRMRTRKMMIMILTMAIRSYSIQSSTFWLTQHAHIPGSHCKIICLHRQRKQPVGCARAARQKGRQING